MASFPSIPLSYASINLRERDANLHNGWEYECLLIDWMNWLSHALEWDSLERCKQIPFQIGFFVRSWVMLVNPFCVSPTLLNEIKLAVKFWQEDDLNTTGFAVCLKHTTCISNLDISETESWDDSALKPYTLYSLYNLWRKACQRQENNSVHFLPIEVSCINKEVDGKDSPI